MDQLTLERMGPDPDSPTSRRVNRWGDTEADIKARQAALDRHWRDSK